MHLCVEVQVRQGTERQGVCGCLCVEVKARQGTERQGVCVEVQVRQGTERQGVHGCVCGSAGEMGNRETGGCGCMKKSG